MGAPDFGVRLQDGPYFCSLMVKDQFSTLNAAVCYKVNNDFTAAATYQLGGTAYKGKSKLKITHDQVVSASYTHSLAKGFTLLGGASYNLQKAAPSFGLQVSVA